MKFACLVLALALAGCCSHAHIVDFDGVATTSGFEELYTARWKSCADCGAIITRTESRRIDDEATAKIFKRWVVLTSRPPREPIYFNGMDLRSVK